MGKRAKDCSFKQVSLRGTGVAVFSGSRPLGVRTEAESKIGSALPDLLLKDTLSSKVSRDCSQGEEGGESARPQIPKHQKITELQKCGTEAVSWGSGRASARSRTTPFGDPGSS